jgi:hypothetical protein
MEIDPKQILEFTNQLATDHPILFSLGGLGLLDLTLRFSPSRKKSSLFRRLAAIIRNVADILESSASIIDLIVPDRQKSIDN